jgi:hypothetical protein
MLKGDSNDDEHHKKSRTRYKQDTIKKSLSNAIVRFSEVISSKREESRSRKAKNLI